MTKPEKQDGTMELDVGQIDLLDLPLPRSKPELESSEPRGSKGPPPLPLAPSLPPAEAAPEEPPVPSLVLPEPSKPRITPAPPVSARKLVGPAPEEKSPIVRFLVGMGAASIVCALAYVGFRTLHKTPAAQAPTPSASAAPTHAFTMAPIEFTEPASSQEPAPSGQASASPPPPSSTAAAATAKPTTSATHAPASTSHATPATTTTSAKPPRTDELIKVEN